MIDVDTSSATISGNVLTLNLDVLFNPAFGGVKNIYMYASGSNGLNSGWQDRGDWLVPSGTTAVTVDSVTPNSASGFTQTFDLTYSSSLSASYLQTIWVWFNATQAPTAAGSCLAYYVPATFTFFLLNDAGTAWHSAVRGYASQLRNSQCTIDISHSPISASGTTVTLSLPVTFDRRFAGAKNVYMYASDPAGSNSGWQDRGDFVIP